MFSGVKTWLVSVALKKVVKRVVVMLVSVLASQKIKDAGLTVEVNQEVVAAAIFSALETLRNFIKTKYGIDFL